MHISSSRFIAIVFSVAIVASVCLFSNVFKTPIKAAAADQLDILILHGKLVDGSGSKPRIADVGIRGDRIVFVGDAAKANLVATRTIDATGLVVAPGFIDPHTHTLGDLSDPRRESNEAYLMQGVTTVITGNDGESALNIGDTLAKWDQQGIGTNALLLAGFGTIRTRVMGPVDASPTVAQLDEMKSLAAKAMDEGAFGMSTGLYYAPQSYAKTEEVIELSKVISAKGGVYDTHMRDEGSYNIGLLGAINETIRIGREAKIPVHISHIKALGPDVWGESKPAIALMKKARAQGVDIISCQYPYPASGTNLGASLLPRWAEAGGRSELLKRIDDPAVRQKMLAEMEVNLKRRGGAESLLLTDMRDTQIGGKRLGEIAQARNEKPVEAALEIIKKGNSGAISFNMSEKDIRRFMKDKLVLTCSDGSSGHPRKYGTFPRKFHEYVYDDKLISLPFFVRNSSARTAEWFHIPERGLIREGYFADIAIFDEKTFADRANYEQPELLATGMKYVIVNGKLAVDSGTYTGALAGRALRKNRPIKVDDLLPPGH